MTPNFLATASLLVLCSTGAQAIILFGKDNTANLTDPGTGAPFQSVGQLSNGSGGLGGSGIYLGNGYVLTANHVTPFSSVTFDGVTFHTHDGAAAQQIGSTDMKVFRLSTTPTVAAVNIYTGNSELNNTSTLVGWGVGRDPNTAVGATVVPWGGAGTATKRWGLNVPKTTTTVISEGYTYEALVTVLGAEAGTGPPTPGGLGADEAATTLFDSGAGMFQQFGGIWYLTGLTTAVETFGTSTFGPDRTSPEPRGDFNFFARVSTYSTQIATLIPEPSSLLLSCLGLPILLRRRR